MSRASAVPDPFSRGGEPRLAPAAGSLRSAVATNPGLVRERNEDRVHADPARGHFLVVDGMGGEAAGDEAAETALEMIRERLERNTGNPEERIREGIAVANNEILARARRNPAWSGMGCVLTVAVVEQGEVTVGHVGDSRLYLLRRGGIEKVTRDHSPVGEREDLKEIDERAAMDHPRRNEVYRSVGTGPHGPFDGDFVDVSRFRISPEDALLLCTDGLTDLVTSHEIAEIVRSSPDDLARAADELVRAALARGGKDNVSVVLAAGPRFAAAWGTRGGRDAASSAREAAASSEERPGGLARPWVAFSLGALAGALLTAAVFLFRGSLPIPTPLESPPDVAAQRVLVVGPGRQFNVIGDALAAARSGDTVRVAPGTYHEQVRLKDGVTLMSATPRGATLVPTSDGTAVVAVVAEGIGSGRIQGFVIKGSRAPPVDIGIRLHDAAVAIDDVEVMDARVAGVVVEGPAPVSLSASWIHDNPGAGVLLRAGANGRLAHDRIENNGRTPGRAAPGIDLEPSARAEIVDNIIVGNAAGGVRGLPPQAQRPVLARNVFEVAGKKNGPALVPAPAGKR